MALFQKITKQGCCLLVGSEILFQDKAHTFHGFTLARFELSQLVTMTSVAVAALVVLKRHIDTMRFVSEEEGKNASTDEHRTEAGCI